jgi:hypothetical protein
VDDTLCEITEAVEDGGGAPLPAALARLAEPLRRLFALLTHTDRPALLDRLDGDEQYARGVLATAEDDGDDPDSRGPLFNTRDAFDLAVQLLRDGLCGRPLDAWPAPAWEPRLRHALLRWMHVLLTGLVRRAALHLRHEDDGQPATPDAEPAPTAPPAAEPVRETIQEREAPADPPRPDGPFDPDGFNYSGVPVRFGRAGKQRALVLSLWDGKRRCPRDARKIEDVITDVWGEGNDTSDGTFRQLCHEIRGRFESAGCPLGIEILQGKVRLAPRPL